MGRRRVKLALAVFVEYRVLGEDGAQLRVVVLDARLLVARPGVAEEHLRPLIAGVVRLKRAEVVENDVAVGQDRREEPLEALEPHLGLDRVEELLHLALGGVLDDVEEREGQLRHREDEDLLVRFVRRAEEIHLPIIGYGVLVTVDEPVGVEVPDPVDVLGVLVFVFLLELPLLQGDLPRQIDGFHRRVDASLDPSVERFLRSFEVVAVGDERVVDRLAFVDDPVLEELVLGAAFLIGEIGPFPRRDESGPRGIVGQIGEVFVMLERAYLLLRAAVAHERVSLRRVALEPLVAPAFGERLAAVALMAADEGAAYLLYLARLFVDAAVAQRVADLRLLDLDPVSQQFPRHRCLVHAEGFADLGAVAPLRDQPLEDDPFLEIELPSFVFAHIISLPPFGDVQLMGKP